MEEEERLKKEEERLENLLKPIREKLADIQLKRDMRCTNTIPCDSCEKQGECWLTREEESAREDAEWLQEHGNEQKQEGTQ
jgi:hypothetical protein